ncbi:hypothetical protein HanRHA438_Chr05g0225061 [Helianthus annuus]|uniref:Uncharacterized protein n=1 Tax=Helianthus annuus TaxID=4232 RepID=A0A9K3EBF2_HELAN|nr:hypothetical protein HanXRQr2_Chr14g0659231 [Helianthus annuus]KAJ0841604.1 hypothetical protein HanPSC8_Chr14g0632281 [Helianthus annuus]KAJ0919055.1 hypothetical protein HanRHA438_Chr05g0225061 [Helianthus annuus]
MHFQHRPSIFNHHLATITLLTIIKHHLVTTQTIEATIGMFMLTGCVKLKDPREEKGRSDCGLVVGRSERDEKSGLGC